MFVKAWAYLCNKIIEFETPNLLLELEPLFNRDIIKGTNENNAIKILLKIPPTEKENKLSLKISPSEPKLKDSLRATFKLTREYLDKIKQYVLSNWEIFNPNESNPETLSSFILTCAYSLVCIAKAIHGVEIEKENFVLVFAINCRSRPEKVEIVSIDRDLPIGFRDSKDGSGEVEICLVLNKHVMDHFSTLFLEGLSCN
ncbi:unnamed protein product [Vicia faba]|uniref:Anthocyanin acyltransferase n=1 Tax=Vicia faba TaxID=3906 RepID=A0AAV0Z1H9_VICFA|nr:unnamed protein product [Vicia faba]